MRWRKKEKAAATQVNYYVITKDLVENIGAWVSCIEKDNEVGVKQKVTSTEQLCQRATFVLNYMNFFFKIRKQNNKLELNFALTPISSSHLNYGISIKHLGFKRKVIFLTERSQLKNTFQNPI